MASEVFVWRKKVHEWRDTIFIIIIFNFPLFFSLLLV